ncbi:MAG TPA: histidine phosphatase family protein [Burkholderiaceae bacterium]|nr:histidine phosphatase family protein [Burkholderiaceae bacterium]
MQPARLVLIRHGETEWNAAGRLQGAIDVPLSQLGLWQAQRVAQRLRGESFAAVVSSDLERARQTATPLAAALGLPVQPEPRLRERAYGIFEGERYAGLAERYPAEWAVHQARDPDWVIPGGESIVQLRDRVAEALDEIARRYAGTQVAVVAHGGVLDAAYRLATGIPWQAQRSHALPNAGINRLRAQAAPLALEILDWADVAHLSDVRDELSVV